MYHQIVGELEIALRLFNHARCNDNWCKEATVAMVEIYLQLDDFELWTTVQEVSDRSEIQTISDSIHSLLHHFNDSVDDQIQTLKGYEKLFNSHFTRECIKGANRIFQSILDSNKVSSFHLKCKKGTYSFG